MREKIDWLAYTSKFSESWQFPDFVDSHWKPISPIRHYTNGEENKDGCRRYWNTIDMKQGRKVEWSGSTLNYTEEQLSRLFSFVSQMDNKVTRVDYCLDIFGQSFEPSGCVRHIKNRDIITHAQSAIINKDWMKGGFTQYVGTKSSETYTRIYDKAAEQKIEGRWSRVETVYQGDRAEASLQAYLQHKSTRPLIRAHVEFPKWKAWKRVMVGDKAKLTVATRRSNTRHWLLEQVAPAIAKELLLDDDQTFLFEMLDRIKGEYRRLSDRNDIYW